MGNKLENRLNSNPVLLGSINKCKAEVTLLLDQYKLNFPTYTDHSIEHTQHVCDLASYLLNDDEIENLNDDEIYVLCMACYLHDIGMCIPQDKIELFRGSNEYKDKVRIKSNYTFSDYLRDIHHELSYDFIKVEWQRLHIVNEDYAKAIALIAMGHRKVDLMDVDLYEPQFFVQKVGRDYVCLPYLGCIIRIADELDISNMRVPDLLFDYFLPNNEKSREEWEKHKSNYHVNFKDDYIVLKAKTSDQSVYHALLAQYKKIKDVIEYCQKVINRRCTFRDKTYLLEINNIDTNFEINFDPKDIGFSFDVDNVFNTLIGEKLYKSKFAAIREVLQNSIDSCRYKKILDTSYIPKIDVTLENNELIVQDNGLGMDEFIVKNYFSKLASSYYATETLKDNYDAIGHFGIGVFSYFLISSSFEVETKMKDKTPLKFIASRDPERYFYFYNEIDAIAEGTKISLQLNDTIDFKDLTDYIDNTFLYVEIDITVSNSTTTKIVKSKNFTFATNVESLKNNIKYLYKQHKEHISIIEVYLKEKDFEGIYGILAEFNGNSYPSFRHFTYMFDDVYFIQFYRKASLISQKGVFINFMNHDYATIDNMSIFSNPIFKINLNSKLQLNINRNELSDLDTFREIEIKFELLLANKVFDYFEHLPICERYDKCKELIEYSFNNIYFFNKSHRELFEKRLIIQVLINNKFRFYKLCELQQFDEFMFYPVQYLSTGKGKHKKVNYKKIFSKHKIPFLIDYEIEDKFYSFIYRYILSSGFYISILFIDNKTIYYVKTKNTNFEIVRINHYESFAFENCSYIALADNSNTIFNLNHEIIKHYLSKKQDIANNKNLNNLYEALFDLISYQMYYHNEDKVKYNKNFEELSDVLGKINNIEDTDLSITKEDFPDFTKST